MARKKANIPPGLKGTAVEIWLAGLGAFNIAGEEGSRIFRNLVNRGLEQQELNKEMMANLTEKAQDLKENAQGLFGRITTPLENGLSNAMQRLGVPTRDEIVKLTHRVEELTRHVSRAKAAAQAGTKAQPKPKPKSRAAKPKAATSKPGRAKASETQVTTA